MNGSSLRGLSMEEARNLLRNCQGEVDIIVARDPDRDTPTAAAAPVERRKRRKLPMIERPRSAPIYAGQVDFSQMGGGDGEFPFAEGAMKTVIRISDKSERIEQFRSGPVSTVDTPSVTPAQSYSNIYPIDQEDTGSVISSYTSESAPSSRGARRMLGRMTAGLHPSTAHGKRRPWGRDRFPLYSVCYSDYRNRFEHLLKALYTVHSTVCTQHSSVCGVQFSVHNDYM